MPTTSIQGVGTYVTQAMNVGTAGKYGTISNLLSQASRFNLSDMEARKIVSDMLEQMPRWQAFFERYGVKEEEAERFRWSFERWREDPDAQAVQASCA